MSTEEKWVSDCPICEQTTMVPHCEASTCKWIRCRNDACMAVLDLALLIGHKRNTERLDRRIRLVLDGDTWRERIEG